MQKPNGSWLAMVAAVGACTGSAPTGAGAGAARVELHAGAGQSQVAGYLLTDTIVVRVVDADGAPIPFAIVDAAVDATDEAPFATVTSIDARTRADGTARFTWRLGLALGAQTLRVTSSAAATVEPLVVTATGTSHPVRALGGSDSGLCVIDLAGQLACWAPLDHADRPPRLVPHPTTERFRAMAMYPLRSGGHRGCAVSTAGRLWCFGMSDGVITELGELAGAYPSLTGIATGGGGLDDDPPFCALAPDGAAWCWGSNPSGVLGDGTTAARAAPAPVATATRFTKLAVASHHACGVTATGSIWCWGSNITAQVGLAASNSPVTTPRRIIELITFSDVAMASDHATCGIGIGGGGAWCWGRKTDLGIGPIVLALIEGPSTPHAIFVSDLPSPWALGRVDEATVAVGPPGRGAWWGDLSAVSEQVKAIAPRPFVKSIRWSGLAMAASRGVVCGPMEGSADHHLCGRLSALSGYPPRGAAPALAGFGVPFP